MSTNIPLEVFQDLEDKDLELSISNMKDLESKLAQQKTYYELSNYSFGFNGAEALYSLDGCKWNTPNSVFPIFWWPRLFDDKPRQTLLTRFQRGLK